MKKIILTLILSFSAVFCFSHTMEASCNIDWTKNHFGSDLSLDVNKAGISMPSGKSIASSIIKTEKAPLIKPFLLTLFVDNSSCLEDVIINEDVTLEQITNIIENGVQTPDIFSLDGNSINTKNKIKLTDVGSLMVRHKYAYIPEESIDTVPSKAFSGIIIDARGSLPVHGEYTKSETYPCFFPEIWDEEMNLIYEKNACKNEIVRKQGMVSYNYKDDMKEIESRVGVTPLYIRAKKVYGRNRTDPVISRRDALKILSVPENRELLSDGKIVILLEKKNLIQNVAIPDKNKDYYATYRTIKQYFIDNKIDVDVEDSPTGIVFSVNLKFIPDSEYLLPEETPRIQKIAATLEGIIGNDEFTILVEGHTADVGKPTGQMNLSVQRTRTVMNALIKEGIPEKLFTYKGYGGTKPISTNATEEGRAQNRRVDITARPRATYIQKDW